MSDETERRDFLKTAGAVLGGITITAVASNEAAAARVKPVADQRARGDCKPTRKVSFRCTPEVTIDNINEAIKAAISQSGCTACGLLGIDLNFYVGNPAEGLNLKVPGIAEGNIF